MKELSLEYISPTEMLDKNKWKKIIEHLCNLLKIGNYLNPILVYKYKNYYYIIDWHHRYAANKLLRKKTIFVEIIDKSELLKRYKDESELEHRYSECIESWNNLYY